MREILGPMLQRTMLLPGPSSPGYSMPVVAHVGGDEYAREAEADTGNPATFNPATGMADAVDVKKKTKRPARNDSTSSRRPGAA
jgi:hypothetical protein